MWSTKNHLNFAQLTVEGGGRQDTWTAFYSACSVAVLPTEGGGRRRVGREAWGAERR